MCENAWGVFMRYFFCGLLIVVFLQKAVASDDCSVGSLDSLGSSEFGGSSLSFDGKNLRVSLLRKSLLKGGDSGVLVYGSEDERSGDEGSGSYQKEEFWCNTAQLDDDLPNWCLNEDKPIDEDECWANIAELLKVGDITDLGVREPSTSRVSVTVQEEVELRTSSTLESHLWGAQPLSTIQRVDTAERALCSGVVEYYDFTESLLLIYANAFREVLKKKYFKRDTSMQGLCSAYEGFMNCTTTGEVVLQTFGGCWGREEVQELQLANKLVAPQYPLPNTRLSHQDLLGMTTVVLQTGLLSVTQRSESLGVFDKVAKWYPGVQIMDLKACALLMNSLYAAVDV